MYFKRRAPQVHLLKVVNIRLCKHDSGGIICGLYPHSIKHFPLQILFLSALHSYIYIQVQEFKKRRTSKE